ncbi:type I restriction-modification system subunit M [Amycolatopsis keratiniphila]|uniref:type I restriction-modification system subunit M n=1 Tax=Amycolatopsis keratiniphila TaxID=129921 RepID=UPI00087BC2EB|nr:class I SAM-dependent DNA methyltransferase [Amycolatopsis keratiniphila]OLZ51893.1 restriction endonuclease subunit M [Amycolatopsis keratiniphila subsp. nogabecina]SDU62195.1 type I restriction enzyme M protein [Amycolatopsis keratiniphila]
MSETSPKNLANFIWQVADLLRGDYKRADYGKVILPFTVLRRLECVLEPTREAVLKEKKKWVEKGVEPSPFLPKQSGHSFYNTTKHTLASIAGAPDDAVKNLLAYVRGFSANAQEAFEKFKFTEIVSYLGEAKLLHLVVSRFADFDLHPNTVSNHEMGYAFEELIRKFAEDSNETAGEHFTPREVIKLMAGLLIAPDLEEIMVPGAARTVYDPACGTGGMLTAAEEFILSHNTSAKVYSFGQELNPESWAICRSDLMIKNQDPENIKLGNSFTDDQHKYKKYDYMLSNPPFGVEWKKAKAEIEDEHNDLGERGRFGAGLPRINDGSLLFLQHMISKMKPASEGGSRLAIVFNGSPLFTGAAESGESRIRQWILENDWLEAIVALPDQLFYNTGISTYFWILTNRKAPAHRGKVVLLDVRESWAKMRKSLGDKRKLITDEQIDEIQRLYADALRVADDPDHELHGKVKVFANEDFGYRRITVERPLKLRFEVTDEVLAGLETTLKTGKATAKYEGRDDLLAALKTLVGQEPSRNRTGFATSLRSALAGVGKLPTAVDKAVWSAVSVRDPEGELQLRKGTPEPDAELREFENVPLGEDVDSFMEREVLPHVPDAWVDHGKTKVGYEILFTRHFYVYTPPRPLAEIDAELRELEAEIQILLGAVTS